MIEHALLAISKGWPVFPLHSSIDGVCTCKEGANCGNRGKHPRIKNNLLQATTDEEQIREWWTKWPNANVGIATGPAGLVVIDIDIPKSDAEGDEVSGLDAWDCLLMEAGVTEPRTYEVLTPSDGLHIYWLANESFPVKTVAGQLGKGLDVRAVNGSITAAGSVRDGEEYVCVRNIDPKPLPPWLRAALGRKRLVITDLEKETRPEPLPVKSNSKYALAALNGELEQLKTHSEGSRNHALNTAAFKLRKFTEAGQLDAFAVTEQLYAVAIELGLKHEEATRTIKSGLKI